MKKLLTGARPTGDLHLGHYVGTIQNWIKMHTQYDTYILIADLHMLTTKNSKEDIMRAAENSRKLVLDVLSCGIDPTKVNFYLQSAIPEISEYKLLLDSLVSVGELKRVPSLKEMAQSNNYNDMNLALLGYPVLQSADILSIGADVVPVGKDNIAHVELTRNICQKFNYKYNTEIFVKPDIIVSETPNLVGIDGKQKMSKSLNNSIALKASKEEVEAAVKKMYTDPNRISVDIPGDTINNPVFIYHRIFNPNKTEVYDLEQRYKKGQVSDVEVKAKLANAINIFLDPIRERREMYLRNLGLIDEIILIGTNNTRELIRKNLNEMKREMGVSSTWNSIRRKAENRLKKMI